MYSDEAADAFIQTARQRGMIPRSIQILSFGSIHMVSAFDEAPKEVISEFVMNGVDKNPRVAFLKAIVESVELTALRHSIQVLGKSYLAKSRSDGVAGYPIFGQENDAKRIARTNAYAEALERFAWARWWDDSRVSFTIEEMKKENALLSKSRDCLRVIEDSTPLNRLLLIRPRTVASSFEVQIFLAQLTAGGWISGGGAGLSNAASSIALRSLSEMMRHSLAYKRMVRNRIEPSTFYEKRLMFFASGAGSELVIDRLLKKGNEPVVLSKLAIDEEIDHPNRDIVYIHRCLFKDQPPFVGGDMERLCL